MDYVIDMNPDEFGDRTDALFHHGESYPLAHGEYNGAKWVCQLVNNGEQKLVGKDKRGGDLIGDEEVLEYYNNDQKLWDAIDNRRVDFINNSWWELVFYLKDESSHWWLDIFADNSEVVDSPKDAVEYFKDLMKDEDFVKDFKLKLVGELEESTM